MRASKLFVKALVSPPLKELFPFYISRERSLLQAKKNKKNHIQYLLCKSHPGSPASFSVYLQIINRKMTT